MQFCHMRRFLDPPLVMTQDSPTGTRIFVLLFSNRVHRQPHPDPVPDPWTPLICSVSVILSFGECRISGIAQCVTFWDWRFPSARLPGKPSQASHMPPAHSFLSLGTVPRCGCTAVCSTVHLEKGTWAVSSLGAVTNKTAIRGAC